MDHARFDNRDWRPVTEREVERQSDERGLAFDPELTECDRHMADRIREAIEAHLSSLNARQPHIERNARKGADL